MEIYGKALTHLLSIIVIVNASGVFPSQNYTFGHKKGSLLDVFRGQGINMVFSNRTQTSGVHGHDRPGLDHTTLRFSQHPTKTDS